MVLRHIKSYTHYNKKKKGNCMKKALIFAKAAFANNIMDHATVIAYKLLFSLFPALFFLASIMGLFANGSQLYDKLMSLIGESMPPEIFGLISGNIREALPTKSLIIFAISLCLALFSGREWNVQEMWNLVACRHSFFEGKIHSIRFRYPAFQENGKNSIEYE